MNNQDFKVRIVDFYKDMDKPTGLHGDNEVKDVLMLSNKTEFPLLQKEKDKWIIKNKGKILKDIDSMKKKIDIKKKT
jgi:predicted ATP-grasp superfamily ATP-dependent carboligase